MFNREIGHLKRELIRHQIDTEELKQQYLRVMIKEESKK